MKHTQGQWKWFWNGYYFEVRGQTLLKPNISVSSFMPGTADKTDENWCDYEETEANAKLIAAAPDLLEACISALDLILDTHDVAIKIKAAINKATN